MSSPTIPQIDNDVYNRLADTWWDENGLLNILKATVNPWRVPYFQRILTRLQIDPKGKRALDVGCGGGLLAEEFATMGFAVTGIDPSETSLAVARAHAAQNGLHIDYRLGYGDELPFENETFEVVYCCDVLEHIPNWDAVIGEIARVLKQNGIFFYDTINRTIFSKIVVIKIAQEWNLTRFFPPNLHVWEMFIKPEELSASLGRHGLHDQDLRGTKLGNPVGMLSAVRQYKTGKISGIEFGRRIGFREGPNMAGSYMGYALK
jgi:2-polyprenyl-6-hydroxyphenyl methylase/3-demethylubiquinone-9 3-methyltransferase